ncbi:pentapeptide repeat-containing protein [Pseudanabaena sp. BC1403]|uniref:pentapeptide repeat-containing protein n=1 Tax=Pseudanabaena sp. BC1403 TaxID=2043171 RepID=UPI002155FD43|nr:pentapeptide repeat-containing protein [Pseudanabaena sp. BC1403]
MLICFAACQPLETALGFIAGIGAIVVAGTAISGVRGAVDISLAVAITIIAAAVGTTAAALAGAAAVTAARIVAGSTISVLVVIAAAIVAAVLSAASANTIVSARASVGAIAMVDAGRQDLGTFMAASGGVLSILLSSYISRRTLMGDENYNLSRKLAGVLAAVRGTCFKGADLTDTNFTQAELKSSDFRGAILMHTCWASAESLSWTRPGESYLQHRSVRQLITKRQGERKVFDGFNLQGINLQGANLVKAIFVGANLEEAILKDANLKGARLIGANLNEADLQNADLRKAQLVQAQLDNADLRGANLTAAYIEDWGITTKTRLDDVKCEFAYMRLPDPDDFDQNCRRKPDDDRKKFAEGEFADFIAPMVHTLDLYHNQNVDPRVLALSIRGLYEKHPDADIRLASIEKKGKKGNILTRLATSEQSNHAELGEDYSDIFQEMQVLPSEEINSLLEKSGNPTQTLANLLAFATNQKEKYFPIINHNYFGEVKMNENQKQINIASSTFGQFIGGDAAINGIVNLGTINGSVTNAIDQLHDSTQSDKLGLKEILIELQKAVSSETSLSDEDKVEALEQLKKLAEAGKNPSDGVMKKMAKQATTMLKGIVTGLPDVTKLVESCNKLLPIISSMFGF